MKKIVLLTLIIAALTAFKSTSTRHITGTVFASDDRKPIPGVDIKVKGSNAGTVTDMLGHFAIDMPEGGSLVFSFIGYQPQTIKPRKADTLNVYLVPSNGSLNEVVVVGYGVKRKKDVTGSVAVVNEYAPQQMLSGKVYGLSVNTQGAPGTSSAAAIRGVSSNNASMGYSVTADANDESYKPITENSFANPNENPLSTFSIDVDAASYSNVRRFINNGQLPSPDAVRIEEMINYFKYDLRGPANNEPVAINSEVSSAPWNPKHLLVRIGLKAKTIDMSKLPPSNLVFLLDISGSMADANKLPWVKESMKMLVDQLRPKDRVAIVVYSGEAGLKLASTPGDEKETINEAIDALQAGGSTAGAAGIKLAYKIARENFMKNGNNRIIMATDGDFNVGNSSDGDMETLITRERNSNVPLTILGFGMRNYKDSKMEILADKGNGNYAYIDNLTEARKKMVSEYGGTMYMMAKDVKLQVEFNPAKVQAYRLLGYEDRLLAKEDFNNDRKDAGDMGAGHTVTALYEIVPAGITDEYAGGVDPLKYQKTKDAPLASYYSDELMTVKFRYKQPDSDVSKMSLVTIKDKPLQFKNASADFRFASAVAEFGMLLRNSDFKQNASFEQVITIAKSAKGADEDGYRSEFVRLVETAKSLAKSGQYLTKK